MTTLRLKLDLPGRFAREAPATGLLTPEAIKQLLQDAMRRLHPADDAKRNSERGEGRAHRPQGGQTRVRLLVLDTNVLVSALLWPPPAHLPSSLT